MERKQTDIIAGTDKNVIDDVQQQYYEVLKILIDPELDGLKSRIQVYFHIFRSYILILHNIWRVNKIVFKNVKYVKEIGRAHV